MSNTNPRFFWAREDTRFHVYPQRQPLVLLRVEYCGAFAELFYHPSGAKVRVPYILEREAAVNEGV